MSFAYAINLSIENVINSNKLPFLKHVLKIYVISRQFINDIRKLEYQYLLLLAFN